MGSIYHVHQGYIAYRGGLYNPYNPLQEPESSIDVLGIALQPCLTVIEWSFHFFWKEPALNLFSASTSFFPVFR